MGCPGLTQRTTVRRCDLYTPWLRLSSVVAACRGSESRSTEAAAKVGGGCVGSQRNLGRARERRLPVPARLVQVVVNVNSSA